MPRQRTDERLPRFAGFLRIDGVGQAPEGYAPFVWMDTPFQIEAQRVHGRAQARGLTRSNHAVPRQTDVVDVIVEFR